MKNCIFCNVADGTVQARIIHKDREFMAFHDVNPQAPVHILVIPTAHVTTLEEMPGEDIIGRMLLLCTRIAKDAGLTSGYRLVLNCGTDAGQSVEHLHIHVLGGRALRWPPG